MVDEWAGGLTIDYFLDGDALIQKGAALRALQSADDELADADD